MRVVGVDACAAGWCAVTAEGTGGSCRLTKIAIYPSFKELLACQADLICIDIPIGLMDEPGQRACDIEARRLLGRPRASSVFPPPCRSALVFNDDYEAASKGSVRLGCAGVNAGPYEWFSLSPSMSRRTPALGDRGRTYLHRRASKIHTIASVSRRQ